MSALSSRPEKQGGGGCRWDLRGGDRCNKMVVLYCKKFPRLSEMFLVSRERKRAYDGK